MQGERKKWNGNGKNEKKKRKGARHEDSSALLNSVLLCFEDAAVKKDDGKQLLLQTMCDSLQLAQLSKDDKTNLMTRMIRGT